jgi:hypothetical protein
MRYLAGEIFQVVCPRAADDDGIIQREGTGVNLSGDVTVSSARLRAQPATLHYTWCPKRRFARTHSAFAALP